MNKKFGKGTLSWASENPFLDIPRLPTGIFSLDYATCGGFPLGRISEMHGEWSSGKTFVGLKTVAMAQRMCRKHHALMLPTNESTYRCPECGSRGDDALCPYCSSKETDVCREDWGDRKLECPVCGDYNPYMTLWMDLEGAYDNRWATQLDINSEYIIVVRPKDAEMCGDIYRAAFLETGIDIGIIDSIAMMTPLDELNESMEQDSMGRLPRLVNRFIRSMVSIQNDNNIRKSGRRPTQIMINQTRQKLGVLYGNPMVKPGGKAQEFASSVDIRFWRASKPKPDHKTKEAVVTVCNFVVEKNRTGPPKRKGSFRVWVQDHLGKRPGFTNEPEVVASALGSAGVAVTKDTHELLTLEEIQGNKEIKVLEHKAVVKVLEADTALWWAARNRLFKYRLGFIMEDLPKAGSKREREENEAAESDDG